MSRVKRQGYEYTEERVTPEQIERESAKRQEHDRVVAYHNARSAEGYTTLTEETQS